MSNGDDAMLRFGPGSMIGSAPGASAGDQEPAPVPAPAGGVRADAQLPGQAAPPEPSQMRHELVEESMARLPSVSAKSGLLPPLATKRSMLAMDQEAAPAAAKLVPSKAAASPPSRDSPPGAAQRWQKAKAKVATVTAVRDAKLTEVVGEKVRGVDLYATKMVESTFVGGFVTLLVWAATITYITVLAVQWAESPATKDVGTEWTIGASSFKMRLVCKARSGCLVSNTLTSKNTLDASSSVPAAQATCFRMEFEEVQRMSVVFSVDPVEGISVMWDPTTTANTTSLQDGGLTVISEIRCASSNDPACTIDLNMPVGKGTALLQHVDTVNNTAEGAGRRRVEWFVNMIDQNGVVLPGSTPCVGTAPADWVQARLRVNSFYNTVLVSKDSFWLFLFGTAGGAYAIFIQVGSLIVVTIGAIRAWRSSRVGDDGGTAARE